MKCKLLISSLLCVSINCLTIGDHVKMLLTWWWWTGFSTITDSHEKISKTSRNSSSPTAVRHRCCRVVQPLVKQQNTKHFISISHIMLDSKRPKVWFTYKKKSMLSLMSCTWTDRHEFLSHARLYEFVLYNLMAFRYTTCTLQCGLSAITELLVYR